MGEQSNKKQGLKQLRVRNFIVIFLAGVINAIGVTLFLYPVKLYDSGISGVSMLLDQITPSYLSLSLFLIVLNIPIFIFGYKKQGLTFTIYSIFAVCVYSAVSFLITNVFDVSVASPLAESDLLLCAIFGGVLSGAGSGFVIRYGGAIDGLDVLSVIFSKRLNISIGTFVLIFNYILYTICGIVLSSWILPLYSMVTYFVASRTVNYITDGFDHPKCAMIVTEKADEVLKSINDNFTTSGTLLDAVGGYHRKKKNVIYFVVSRFQINKLKTLVTAIDSHALFVLMDVSEAVEQRQHPKEQKKEELKVVSTTPLDSEQKLSKPESKDNNTK